LLDNLLQMRCKPTPPFLQEVVSRRQLPEIGQRRIGCLGNPFVPGQGLRYRFESVDLDPVTFTSPAVSEAKLELSSDINQVRSPSSLDYIGNVFNTPCIFLSAQ
jgi:hypothetical protein